MATISFRLSDEEKRLITDFSKRNNITVSELILNSILEKIEDEYDLKIGIEASEEFKENPISYSMDEMRNKYGL